MRHVRPTAMARVLAIQILALPGAARAGDLPAPAPTAALCGSPGTGTYDADPHVVHRPYRVSTVGPEGRSTWDVSAGIPFAACHVSGAPHVPSGPGGSAIGARSSGTSYGMLLTTLPSGMVRVDYDIAERGPFTADEMAARAASPDGPDDDATHRKGSEVVRPGSSFTVGTHGILIEAR